MPKYKRLAKRGSLVVNRIKPSARAFKEASVIELLESRNLVDTGQAMQVLETLDGDAVTRLAADLFDFLDRPHDGIDGDGGDSLFNWIAGSAIRGDSGCSDVSCRAKKVDTLSRLAALYADRVALPVPLQHPDFNDHVEVVRTGVMRSVVSILEMRPLVEAGVVIPVAPALHYCSGCSKKSATEYAEGLQAAIELAHEEAQNFKFRLSALPQGFGMVMEIVGPPDYVEHGMMARLYRGVPSWAKPILSSSKMELNRRTVRELKLVEEIFSDIATDSFMSQAIGARLRATYVTSSAGEARLCNRLSNMDPATEDATKLLAELTHTVPLLSDLPIRALLKVRNSSFEAFDQYRTTMRGIVRDYVARQNSSGKRPDGKELYNDVVRPKLVEVKREAESERRRWHKRSTISVASVGAVLTLGATGALHAQQVLAVLGGAMLSKLVDLASETPDTAKASNKGLYFLLQLEREGKRLNRP